MSPLELKYLPEYYMLLLFDHSISTWIQAANQPGLEPSIPRSTGATLVFELHSIDLDSESLSKNLKLKRDLLAHPRTVKVGKEVDGIFFKK